MKQVSARRRAVVVALTANVVILAVSCGTSQTVRAGDPDRPEDQRALQETGRKGLYQEIRDRRPRGFRERDEIVFVPRPAARHERRRRRGGTGPFTRLFADKVGKTGECTPSISLPASLPISPPRPRNGNNPRS